jgi:hypothetical protein
LLASSVRNGSQPADKTLVAPSSFPALNELQKKRATSAAGS